MKMCNMIILVMFLMMATDVQAQCERPVFGENRILDDESGQSTFPDGATVKFKCSSGYVPLQLSASRFIICNGSQWSELQLQCQKRSCGNPGEILNGRYIYQPTDGNLFGAVITAECNEGYQLFGHATRNCRQTGWDSRAPVCEATVCKAPPGIENGTFNPIKESYEYGDGIIFSCNKGFHLFGEKVLSCSSNGDFHAAVPRCLSVSCEKPDIRNAHKTDGKSPPYKYKQFVSYQCDEGFKMEGSGFLICTEKGWDPAPPRCNVITCPNPPNLQDGLFYPVKGVYQYKDKVTYSCIQGFSLNKASSISCTLNGIFEPLLSQCRKIFCPSPDIPGGFVHESDRKKLYEDDDMVHISCYDGYKLKGSDVMTCKEHGWSPSIQGCIELTCVEPNIPDAFIANGKASSYKYKSSIQIQCHPGYKIEGSGLLTCGENGWNSLPLPVCRHAFCVEPTINNGFIVGDKVPLYEYKSEIRIDCSSGYSLTGPDHLTCEENGWDHPPPTCSFGYGIWILLSVLVSLCLAGLSCCLYFILYKRIGFVTCNKRSDQSDVVKVPTDSSPAEEILLKPVK